jgi:hypothetical protein
LFSQSPINTGVGDISTAVFVNLWKTHNPNLSWTPSSPRQMMCATPDCGRAVMDILVWLRSLGLGQYEAAFRDNAISEKVLPRLTAEDLKDLGVSTVGDRRILLDAIVDLRSGAKPIEAPSTAFETATPPSKDTAAERRQVTVMFSDLVGSTALSARMDPKTSAKSFRRIRSALLRPCVGLTGS